MPKEYPAFFPSQEDVRRAVMVNTADLPLIDEDEEGHDLRLQVLDNGDWQLHTGLADYDTDHHGYWGLAGCWGPLDHENAWGAAGDLLDSAADQYWSDLEDAKTDPGIDT